MSRTTPPTAVAPAAVGIRPATVADIDQITATLADAFLDTPDARWLIPDRPARETVYPPLCAVFADYALRHGRVDITSDGSGVAVWYPYTGTDVAPDPAEADRRITAACGRHADRFQLLDATFAARHPQTPHHYLAYLGVTPARQCQGIGSALLAHHHAALDTAGLPAYLVAVSSGSRDLYARHGYTIHGAGPFHLPEAGPPMWPMLRSPQPAQRPQSNRTAARVAHVAGSTGRAETISPEPDQGGFL